jgi:hypothetical protein
MTESIDGLKCAEEAAGACQCRGDGPWEPLCSGEQLGPGIPQQAFAAQVHVRCKIKLVDWLWIVWIGGNPADTVLRLPKLISDGNMLHIVLYNMLYSMLYSIVWNTLYSMLYNMLHNSIIKQLYKFGQFNLKML